MKTDFLMMLFFLALSTRSFCEYTSVKMNEYPFKVLFIVLQKKDDSSRNELTPPGQPFSRKKKKKKKEKHLPQKSLFLKICSKRGNF